MGALKKKSATVEPLVLEKFVPYQLSVIANRVSQAIAAIFEKKYNIQIPEWRIVAALAELGPMSAYEVADKTSMDRARVSRAQKRLADLKLISITIDENDRRKTILELTDPGIELSRAVIPDALRTSEWLLAVLNDKERRQLDQIMAKLFERTQELKALGGMLSDRDNG